MTARKQAKSAYQALLSHPDWQKVRLKVMERDGWKCRHCACTHKQLHVHHLRYIRGRKPWEYPLRLLITLCEDCHDRMHGIRSRKRALLRRLFAKAKRARMVRK